MSTTVGDFFWQRLSEPAVRRVFRFRSDGSNALVGALDDQPALAILGQQTRNTLGDSACSRGRLNPRTFSNLPRYPSGARNGLSYGSVTDKTEEISAAMAPHAKMPENSAQRPRASGEKRAVAGPVVIVVMGVSGSGKTTVAAMLAGRLHWRFEEGDNLHSAANIAKMSRGIPLTDDDRWPWLQAIAAVIAGWLAEGQSGVVACSALKRAYRRIITGDHPAVRLVYLKGSRELILRRMAARHGHFMPVSLLDSQFETLEEPTADERPIIISIDRKPDEIVTEIVAALSTP